MKEQVFDIHARLEQQHWWFRGRRAIIIPIIERVLPKERRAIVDVGCGTGGTVAVLSKRHRCIGIDQSELAINTAHTLYPDAQFRCGVVPRDIHDLREEAGIYLLMDVLEHIEEDRAFLERIVFFANPGSIFLITVPAHQELWSEHDVTAGHCRRYNSNSLRALWTSLPVRERLLSPINYRLYPIVRFLRYVGRRLNHSWGGRGTDFFLPPAPINEALTWIFSGEYKTVLGRLDKTSRNHSNGVSLIALLEKDGAMAGQAGKRAGHKCRQS
jgi:2-polyprenyl-3-methyl-5-hydroxy-6-metoxy-1,4-benzoquinol methylase